MECISPGEEKYSPRNSRSSLAPSAAVLRNRGTTCMYVPETFQRNPIEASPYCDSGRFCARAPASNATPIPPVCTSG